MHSEKRTANKNEKVRENVRGKGSGLHLNSIKWYIESPWIQNKIDETPTTEIFIL